jgi:hypothetical protein
MMVMRFMGTVFMNGLSLYSSIPCSFVLGGVLHGIVARGGRNCANLQKLMASMPGNGYPVTWLPVLEAPSPGSSQQKERLRCASRRSRTGAALRPIGTAYGDCRHCTPAANSLWYAVGGTDNHNTGGGAVSYCVARNSPAHSNRG